MKRTSRTLEEMLGPIPANVLAEVDHSTSRNPGICKPYPKKSRKKSGG